VSVEVIRAMLDTLELPALTELERVLRIQLADTPTAAERRVAELGFLAELMSEAHQRWSPELLPQLGDPRRIDRSTYDELQPVEAPGTPSSKRLVERYGSWMKACRAADGLLTDGRQHGPGLPWRNVNRGRPRTPKYTREEINAAIRRCARELNRIPGANDYATWVTAKKAKQRANGGNSPHLPAAPTERLPSLGVLYRRYPEGPNRWRQAVDEAFASSRRTT
jgi:hypothetical protein